MVAKVYVWSEIGHTPLTNRKGSYCDVLVKTDIEVKDHNDARNKVENLIGSTKYGHDGHYSMPMNYPNQNQRTGFVSK